jgi:ferric-dicitrate binding protein FerR (iron transport regulator)
LVVDGAFGGTTRTVMLCGEAVFDVAHEDGVPFLVHTGAVTTRVLGTTFDVAYYAADRAVRIAVVSGKVAAGGRRTPVLLTAGTVGWVTDSTVTATIVSDPSVYTTWVDGQLTFDHVPVRDLLTTVGRWYGYAFRLDDSVLAIRQVSTTLKIDAPTETMTALEQLLDVSMTFHGDTVVLHRQREAERRPDDASRRERNGLSTTREVGR